MPWSGSSRSRRPKQAMAALKKMAAPNVQVIRDGHQQTIPARELVAGDIVLLEAGNYVPADMRLDRERQPQGGGGVADRGIGSRGKGGGGGPGQGHSLGDRKNTVFMSTLITYGRGKGLVTATGMHTQIGLIAEMLQSYERRPPPSSRSWSSWARSSGRSAWSSAASSSSTASSATPI